MGQHHEKVALVDRTEPSHLPDTWFIGNRVARWTLVAYSVWLLAATLYVSVKRHLWFDEILTYYVATLPNLSAIWHALLLPLDGQPPLFYLPAHYVSGFLGSSELALRLPSVIGYWLATLILYVIVVRRTAPLYGIMAALLPSSTAAFKYAFEARPYALLLMFASLSFLCWQLTKEGRYRSVGLAGLALSLAAAVSVHYNAALIALPLFVGELSYAYRKRKIDWAVFVALSFTALPLPLFLPQIQAIHVFSVRHWTPTDLPAFFDIYFLLAPKLLLLAFVALPVAIIFSALTTRQMVRESETREGFPWHEIAAAGSYLLLPVAGFLLARYTHALHYRYVLPTIIGLAVLISHFFYQYRPALGRVPALLVIALALDLLYSGFTRMRSPDEKLWGSYGMYADFFDPGTSAVYQSNQELALGDGPYAMVLRYGNSALRRRSFYPVYKHQSDNSVIIFHAIQASSHVQLDMRDYDELKREHRSFLLFGPEWWMVPRFVKDGADVQIKALLEDGPLYSVSFR